MKKIIFYLLVLVLSGTSTVTGYAQPKQQYYYLLVGTYTKTQNQGIFVYEFDSKNGKLKPVTHTENIIDPSYLAINNNGSKIYSVGEGKKGAVHSFNFNNKTGEISLINKQSVNGSSPCYISISKGEKHLFVANYSSGSISVLPINNDGSIAPLAQLIEHKGNSIDKQRQNSAHAHSIINSPDGSYAYAADLGTDKIYAYSYSPLAEKPLQEASSTDAKPGTGPRHFVFNQKGNYAYLIGELDATISVYNYQDNELKEIQNIDMNAAGFNGTNGAADIHLSNDGKFLYASNRGSANEIVIFKVDKKTGKLIRIAAQSCMGKTPRNFVIDPSDNFLLVANQNSDDIFVFNRNKKTGLLNYSGESVKVGAPVCLKFTPKN